MDAPGLIRDLLKQAAVGDVLDEDRRNPFVAHLFDEASNVLRGGFGFGAETLRGQEGQPVVAPEVLKGVVAGDDGSAIFGQFGDNGADLGIESLDLGDIGGTVLIEGGGILRIDLRQRGGDVVDIGHRIVEALPGMRIESAMVMMRMVVAVIVVFAFVVVIVVVAFGMIVVVVFVLAFRMLIVVIFVVIVMRVLEGYRCNALGRDRQVIGIHGSESWDTAFQAAFSSCVMSFQTQWASALDWR